MDGSTTKRVRIREWVRRYLPCEVAGTVGEFGAAALVYAATDSLAAAAVAASVGASGGYYAAAYLNALRWSHRDQAHRPALARLVVAALLALRSVAIEFGPAEVIDSIAVRPLAFYFGPALFGNVAAGWVFGKLVSDVAFYTCAVFSYEHCTSLLAQRVPDIREDDRESATTISAA
ncbi:hypothetical protein MJO55_22200 [Mycolicibacterium rufum]|uniref:Uncharacterized protein n=1 Tax=Mycolicibacterium rufum TaxID=318424 RepID=A0A9X3BKE4_9MYCO|nr:hypothetical protein [Mycolicibacterium rufum]KGI69689.1 hypothetical protein EU78_22135 [Mycolicibacterium rufum]MCV7073794.1 hypothetical protein [Mycolicibacterium rufum]ULP35926.1 hypothetical protein MJO55_22200 [Mycolicibacterium rufum]